MVKVKFTPEQVLNCQKVHWMEKLGVFKQVDSGEDYLFAWNWTGTKFQPIFNAINGLITDTSKAYVDKVFKNVYGYSSEAAERYAVEKPNYTNGFKDCKLVDTDKGRQMDCFYQKLLFHSDSLREYRYSVMDRKVVYCIVKNKTVSRDNLIGKVVRYEFIEKFATDRLNAFCDVFNLDYGELDVIYFNGLEYIIDVNPTPGDAAFIYMPKEQVKKYVNDYARLMKQWL